MAGIFKGLGGASSNKDANYVRPCQNISMIRECKIIENRKKETFFLCNLTCIHDLDPKNFVPGKVGHSVGEDYTVMYKASSDSFLPNVKAFLCGVCGLPEEAIGEEEAEKVCGYDQPLFGTFVELHARNIVTRAGTDYTKVSIKREVPPQEAQEFFEALGEKGKVLLTRLLPNNALARLVEAAAAAA